MSEDGFWRDLWVVQVVQSLTRGVIPAVPEPVALAVHLQDVHVVGEPVQQRAGEAFRPEDLGPLIEWEVGGHHDGTPLVALAEYLEEQFRAGAGRAARSPTRQ